MSRLRWSWQVRKLERRLRQERPAAPDQLVRAIHADLVPRRRRVLRAAAALPSTVLTVAALLGLVAVGGLGFAASHLANTIIHLPNHVYVPQQTALRINVFNPGNDQYGTTTTTPPATSTTTTTTTTTTATTTTAAATTTAAVTTSEVTTTPGVTTTTLTPTGTTAVGITFALTTPSTSGGTTTTTSTTAGGGTIAPVSIAASIPPQAFTSAPGPVTIQAGAPAEAATSTLSGQNSVAFTVNASSGGTTLHNLGAVITFTVTAACGYRPAVFENGAWRAMTLVTVIPPALSNLDATYHDGYSTTDCTAAAQTYSLYTGHLSTFGIIAPRDLGLSESGRKLKTAGSGQFGDPELIHAGRPTLRIVKAALRNGKIALSYFVDEQASAYLHVYSGSKELHILAGKSTYRGHTVGGAARTTIHVAMLRPGTANATLAVATLKRGSKVSVTVIDFDGNKVTKTATIK